MPKKEVIRKCIIIVILVCLIPIVFSVVVEFYLRFFNPYYYKKVDTILTDEDAIFEEMPDLPFSQEDVLLFERVLSSRQFLNAENFGYGKENLFSNGNEAKEILGIDSNQYDEVEIQIEGEKQGSFSVLIVFYEEGNKSFPTKELRCAYRLESVEGVLNYSADGYSKYLYTDIKATPESSANRVSDIFGNPIELPFTYVEYSNENGCFEKRKVTLEVKKWKHFEFPYL